VVTKLAGKAGKTAKGATGGPSDLLKNAVQGLLVTAGQRATSKLTDKVSSTAQRLNDYADSSRAGDGVKTGVTGARKLAEGKSPMSAMLSTGFSRLKDKVKEAFGGGSGKGGGKKLKVTNIVESMDVGVPVELAYAQWTQFADFPKFMKKVENVEQTSEEKVEWKAQIFWSHRTWEATILEQVPNERIIWRSKGKKGHVDGAVTFHEIAPSLTRILLVLEYHPQGLFERTGNLWRAQGRRTRLELKHFRRHVMTESVLHQDEIQGWQGEIRDGQVVDGEGRPDEADEETDELRDTQDSQDTEDSQDIEDTDEDRDESDESDEDEADEDRDEYADSEEEPEELEEPEEEVEERPARRRPAAKRRSASTGSSGRTATKTRARTTKARTGGGQ